MSKHTIALQKIATILTGKFSKQKFESAKLSDGSTMVEYSKLEAGGDFSVADDQGNLTLAAAGEYELEDGTVVIVKEPGKIDEVKPAAPPADGDPTKQDMAECDPTDPAADPSKGGIDWSERIKDMERQLAWQAEALASLKNAMATFKKDTSEVFAAFQEYVEADANSGTGGAITKPAQSRFKKNEEVVSQARDRFRKAFKALDAKQAGASK